MRFLLDSHVVLWLTTETTDSSPRLDALVDDVNETLVSAVTLWELEIKRLKGQLKAPANLLHRLEDAAFACSA